MYGQLRSGGRQIPGEDARRGIKGSPRCGNYPDVN